MHPPGFAWWIGLQRTRTSSPEAKEHYQRAGAQTVTKAQQLREILPPIVAAFTQWNFLRRCLSANYRKAAPGRAVKSSRQRVARTNGGACNVGRAARRHTGPEGWNVWLTLAITPGAEKKPAEPKRVRAS
jgi:hypothetical protein